MGLRVVTGIEPKKNRIFSKTRTFDIIVTKTEIFTWRKNLMRTSNSIYP